MKVLMLIIGISAVEILLGCTNPVDNEKGERCSNTIDNDTVWNTDTHSVTCDLYVESVLSIGENSIVTVDPGVKIFVGDSTGTASLIIGKGTTIYFGEGAGILVACRHNKKGTLIARGTSSDSITFTRLGHEGTWGIKASLPGSPNWNDTGGICIGTNAGTQTSLTFCIIEYANIGMYITSANVEISNCAIRNCIYDGIFFTYFGPRDSASFLDNAFTANGRYPLSIPTEGVGTLSGIGDFSDNGINGIHVREGRIYPSAIWKKHNVPYVIDGSIKIEAGIPETLIVRPGCRLEFIENPSGSSIIINWDGTLIAEGTANEPIIFTRNEAGTFWEGVNIGGELYSGRVSLKYCTIEYAETGITSYAPTEISNCIIRNCAEDGIAFLRTSNFNQKIVYGTPKDSAFFLNNIDTGNGGYALLIYANQVGNLSGTGDFSGNAKNAILVRGDTVKTSATWKKHNAPYEIGGWVNIGTSVIIRSGCRFEFTGTESYLQVGYTYPGNIIVQGQPDDYVVFTRSAGTDRWGFNGGATMSGGIYFASAATSNSTLHYCDISFATTGIFAKVPVDIQYCRIHENEFYGIYFNDTGLDANVMNNTFTPANGLGDVTTYTH